MTRRSRSPIPAAVGAVAGLRHWSRAWLVVAFLAMPQTPLKAQDPVAAPSATDPKNQDAPKDAPSDPPEAPAVADPPLYRDPDPSDGARVIGPLLSARPPSQIPAPPPTSDIGPFQPPGSVRSLPNLGANANNGPEPVQQPLLIIPPSPPPLPALPLMPMMSDDQVGIQRSTEIKSPNGPLGVFSDWFHQVFLWKDQQYEYVTLPATLLWKPPIANLREPQFYGIFHNIKNKSYIDTAIGAEFGLGRLAPVGKSDPTKQLENEGLQLDVFGAVFTRFDPKRFLTAIDYRAGIPLVYKKGPWSTKLSYEHTSTHIGDEYSQAYHVKQVPWSLTRLSAA